MASQANKAPRRSRAARRTYWAGRVGAWRDSGLKQSAFCRREGLGLAVFSWWKRRLERELGATGSERPACVSLPGAFVPVRAAEVRSCEIVARPAGILELELRNGRVLRFPSSLAPEDLVRWAGALEARPC